MLYSELVLVTQRLLDERVAYLCNAGRRPRVAEEGVLKRVERREHHEDERDAYG